MWTNCSQFFSPALTLQGSGVLFLAFFEQLKMQNLLKFVFMKMVNVFFFFFCEAHTLFPKLGLIAS